MLKTMMRGIGLATAKAIAYGLGIPLVGISTLAALALAFRPKER